MSDRTWTRAARWQLCGGCNAEIKIAEPIQVFTLACRLKVRCRQCATGTPPDDLPAHVEHRAPDPTPLRPLAGMLPLDFRARAAGEREPGEDDA